MATYNDSNITLNGASWQLLRRKRGLALPSSPSLQFSPICSSYSIISRLLSEEELDVEVFLQ